VVRVVDTPIQRLPDEILNWQSVLTHVHTFGNSKCSGQQSLDDVVDMAFRLGFRRVMLNEHTSNPESPFQLKPYGKEVEALNRHRNRVSSTFSTLIAFGIECNTVPITSADSDGKYGVRTRFELDVPHLALARLWPKYVVGSLHGDASTYKSPHALMAAIRMLCEHPYVDTLGHITRYVSDVPVDWTEVAQMAADTGTLIELNLNQWFKECRPENQPKADDSGDVKFHRQFVEAVAGSTAQTVIGADIHNAGMWPTLEPVKGSETSVESVIAFHEFLVSCGITPERVINSDLARFDNWIKATKASRSALIAR